VIFDTADGSRKESVEASASHWQSLQMGERWPPLIPLEQYKSLISRLSSLSFVSNLETGALKLSALTTTVLGFLLVEVHNVKYGTQSLYGDKMTRPKTAILSLSPLLSRSFSMIILETRS
jgi:hypothetical protein